MNLIVNRQLDRAQKQVIQELTLKKRQSKKSTMSAKQVAARQQLACELMHERLESPLQRRLQDVLVDRHQEPLYHPIMLAHSVSLSESQPTNTSLIIHDTSQLDSLTITSTDDQSIDELPSAAMQSSGHHQNLAGSTGSSFSRSDSSYSASSSTSAARDDQIMLQLVQQHLEQQPVDEESLKARKKEANIKFLNIRLEHLNGELERKLYQYEYLVAQEKALLGTKNIMLFTQQGVNNFHLFDAHSTPARRIRSFQQQRQQTSQIKPKNQDDSPNNKSELNEDTIANHEVGAALVNQQPTRAHLNSSVSTVANLNTMHMLPSLAGPRRSASSVALMNMSQAHVIE